MLLCRCCVFLFRKLHPGVRYAKQDGPLTCIPNYFSGV
jgi:hypothetical protein